MSRERVAQDAASRNIPIEIVARPPADSLEEAAAILGVDPGTIVKSLVLKRRAATALVDRSSAPQERRRADGHSRHDGTYLFALIPGDRQISWPKLRAVVGVNKLQLPDASQALEATGYERGTITPLGSTTAWPVFADERIAGHRIAMGAGEHGYSAWVEADDLVRGYDATLADISEPMPERAEG